MAKSTRTRKKLSTHSVATPKRRKTSPAGSRKGAASNELAGAPPKKRKTITVFDRGPLTGNPALRYFAKTFSRL
jgi:hypothetical protein